MRAISIVRRRRARRRRCSRRATFRVRRCSGGGGGGSRAGDRAARRRSADARCSRRTTRGTRTCRSCRCAPTRRRSCAASARPADARCCTPTSAAAARTASRSRSCPRRRPRVPIHYTAYGDESDPGPFPIPANAPVEGGSSSTGDRHVLVVQQATCHLFELYRAFWRGNRWDADVRRELEPRVEQAAPARVDVGRRRGPADPCRASCATTRSHAGAIHHALRFTVAADADAATSSRRRTTRRRRPTRRCRRWVCACG